MKILLKNYLAVLSVLLVCAEVVASDVEKEKSKHLADSLVSKQSTRLLDLMEEPSSDDTKHSLTKGLLDRGASVNAYRGNTSILHSACETDLYPRVVSLLIARGANVNWENYFGFSAICGVCRHTTLSVFEILLLSDTSLVPLYKERCDKLILDSGWQRLSLWYQEIYNEHLIPKTQQAVDESGQSYVYKPEQLFARELTSLIVDFACPKENALQIDYNVWKATHEEMTRKNVNF